MKRLLILCLILLFVSRLKAQSTENYIAEHVECAQNLMHEYKIPASIILGIAIHESAAGQSKIAKLLNNHFGIKGPNGSEIRSAYRNYECAEESYNHFVEVMETRSAFHHLFGKYDQYDYRGWASGIQRSGYARSRSWARQLISLIEKYKLYTYDERPEDYEEPVYASTVSHQRSAAYAGYMVRPGDNLAKIARKKGTTVKALMKKNRIKDARLKPGQKIRI